MIFHLVRFNVRSGVWIGVGKGESVRVVGMGLLRLGLTIYSKGWLGFRVTEGGRVWISG